MKKDNTSLIVLFTMTIIISAMGLLGEFLLDKVGLAKAGGQLTFWLVVVLIISIVFLMVLIFGLNAKTKERALQEYKPSYTYNDQQISKSHSNYTRSGDYQYNSVGVAIPPSVNCHTDYSDMKIGDSVLLVHEPSNSYDSKAVALYHNGNHIGYLYKNKLQDMFHDFEARGDLVIASIASFPPSGKLTINLDFTRINEDEDGEDDDNDEL